MLLFYHLVDKKFDCSGRKMLLGFVSTCMKTPYRCSGLAMLVPHVTCSLRNGIFRMHGTYEICGSSDYLL